MSRVPPIAPLLDVPAPTAADRPSTLHDRVHAVVHDFGPLALALSGGVLLGTLARGSFPAGAAAGELALVVLVAGAAAAAILPRENASAGALPLAGVLAAQKAHALLVCAAAAVLAATRGLDAAIAWAPLLICLQSALAAGLALFAAAVARTRVGRILPARALVPLWLLATPGAWLVHASAPDAGPAWNPLHHLVAAWRAILLPGVGASEPLEIALLALAPAALLCALAGFAALAATESDGDA